MLEGLVDVLDARVEIGDEDLLGALFDRHRQLAQLVGRRFRRALRGAGVVHQIERGETLRPLFFERGGECLLGAFLLADVDKQGERALGLRDR